MIIRNIKNKNEKINTNTHTHIQKEIHMSEMYWYILKAWGEVDNRGWDCWVASLTQRTWVWTSSGSWWWTGKPGMLQSLGSQRVRHDWAAELMEEKNYNEIWKVSDWKKVSINKESMVASQSGNSEFSLWKSYIQHFTQWWFQISCLNYLSS